MADIDGGRSGERGDPRGGGVPGADPGLHPNLPSRRAVLLAVGGVVGAGVLGAAIGWGLVATSCSEDPTLLQRLLEAVKGFRAHVRGCDASLFGGALLGAVVAVVGAAVVAVLVLRAMSEWQSHPPRRG